MRRVWIVAMILLIPLSAGAITRDEVVYAAETEANRVYNSASSGEALFNNLFHPNYRVGDGCPDHSTLEYWDWDTKTNDHGGLDTIVTSCTWKGAPYCFGGNTMGDDCQALINSGYGVGAHQCHYGVYGEDINTWAAGIDCSGFVGLCLGIGTNCKTADLPGECEAIGWDELQPGDLIINPGSHVVMFIGWTNQEPGEMIIAEATWTSDRVVEHTAKKKDYENSYTPYKPTCIGGEPAAKVAGFRVEVEEGVLHLRWKTECERDTKCFWVERAPSKDGPWEKITQEIPSKGTNTSGAKYDVVDEGYSGGRMFYRLMEREVGYRVLVDRIEAYEG